MGKTMTRVILTVLALALLCEPVLSQASGSGSQEAAQTCTREWKENDGTKCCGSNGPCTRKDNPEYITKVNDPDFVALPSDYPPKYICGPETAEGCPSGGSNLFFHQVGLAAIVFVVQFIVNLISTCISEAGTASLEAASQCGDLVLDVAADVAEAAEAVADFVDTEVDLSDIGGGETFDVPAVGRCRLVLNKPFPEVDGPAPHPQKFKPKFVFPLPYSMGPAGGEPVQRPPTTTYSCSRCAQKVPREAISKVTVPGDDALKQVWSDTVDEATKRYNETPLRNDLGRHRLIRALQLFSKLDMGTGTQSVGGFFYSLIDGDNVKIESILYLVAFVLAWLAGKVAANMRKKNSEESRGAVKSYVNDELAPVLKARGLYCEYATEKRYTVALTYSLSAKFCVNSCAKGTEVKAPVIFIDNQPIKKDTSFSKVEKLLKFAEKIEKKLAGEDAEPDSGAAAVSQS